MICSVTIQHCLMINSTVTYIVGQHHSSHYHRQLIPLLADNVSGMHHLLSFVRCFISLSNLNQMSTIGLDYLLLLLHTVMTGYVYYRFHPMDYVLTTTLLESLSDFSLAPTYVTPHVCPCATFVNSRGTHGLSCKRDLSKLARLAVINNLIHRALVKARIPSTMELPVFLAQMASVLMALL